MTEPRPLPGDAGSPPGTETSYAWLRLWVSLALSTIGSVGLWSAVVVLPAVQAEFAATRAAASLPYTASMIGFVLGQVLMGRLADRLGLVVPAVVGTVALSLGYGAAGLAQSLGQLVAAYAVLIGFASSATFGPVIADVSHWFHRRRGLAIAICSCGSYLAGTVWPPIVQHFVQTAGWRATHLGIGVTCAVTMLPLALALRRRAPAAPAGAPAPTAPRPAPRSGGVSPGALQALLMVAGVACCVAMAMPQVHIVAYCGDLGHGAARGAEMLSLMLGFGIVSRLASGWLSDRIGPLVTLLLGSALQAVSLLLYLPFSGLGPLYVVSALFGLFQGGIVPSYAVIVREHFPPAEAGTRIGLVLSATIAGMALGGVLSGAIFDLTHSYRLAFLHGFLWNLLNLGIARWLRGRLGRERLPA